MSEKFKKIATAIGMILGAFSIILILAILNGNSNSFQKELTIEELAKKENKGFLNFEISHHDFGYVKDSVHFVYPFTCYNKSVKIDTLVGTCACYKVISDKKIYKVGEKGFITVYAHSTSQKGINKILIENNSIEPQIFITFNTK